MADEEMMEQVRDRTTLVLAYVAKRMKHSHSKWARGVIQKLENRLGIHGIYLMTFVVLGHSLSDNQMASASPVYSWLFFLYA